jgi:molybdopterin/thiamine biosynthesis adenylyltransferase
VSPASPAPGHETRFDRQLGLPGIGSAEQSRLRRARVVVAGVGGVGGAAATYLAAAGVARLDLIHPGDLELPDLNRQTLMTPAALGRPRVRTAVETLARHFPDVEVVGHDMALAEPSVPALLDAADVVVDARHNFPERYLLNRLCAERGRPLVVAAMDGTRLQLLTCTADGPCWRCVFPQPDPDWDPLGFRVLGAVAGTAGCLAAAEAVKLLTGAGSVLRGRLLYADLWEMRFDPVPVRPMPGCPDCARRPAASAADGEAAAGVAAGAGRRP